jgi:fatty-acid desaturase
VRWWEVDVTDYAIRALALVGLAGNVKVPSPEAQEARWAA